MESRRVPGSEGVFLRVLSWSAAAVLRPFLLVHGLSSNALLWQQVAEILAHAGHPVHAIDLRSHGLSDAPEAGYSTAVAADDVAAAAAALGVSHALAAGQSWGGNVVIDLAVRHPATVAGLALVDGGLFNPSMVFRSREAWRSAATPPTLDGTDADAMRARLRASHPDWNQRAIEATMGNVEIVADGTVRRRLSINHHMQIAMDMWDSPPAKQYAEVKVPVMAIPALGAATAIDRAAHAAAEFPDAIVRAHPGDHDLHAQQPEAIAADLLELASRVGPL